MCTDHAMACFRNTAELTRGAVLCPQPQRELDCGDWGMNTQTAETQKHMQVTVGPPLSGGVSAGLRPRASNRTDGLTALPPAIL